MDAATIAAAVEQYRLAKVAWSDCPHEWAEYATTLTTITKEVTNEKVVDSWACDICGVRVYDNPFPESDGSV